MKLILLDEIVRKCNEPQPDPEPEIQPEPKKRGRRRKIKTIVSMVPDDHMIGQLIAECKRNGIEELEEEDSDDEDEEQEIEVRKIVLHNVTYLIDENDTVYDMETHDELGKYDKNTLQIVYD